MPVTAYSTTAASNNGAVPNGAPEGMAPSSVNDVIRQIMADIALESQINNVKVLKSVSGTNTITADMDPELSAYSAGMVVVFTPAGNNTGATTLSIDGLTALDVQKRDGDALVSGDLVSGIPALLVLDSGADDWILINPQASGAGSGVDADTLDGISSAGFAQVSSGSFTGTLTGCTTSPTATFDYIKIGDHVTISARSGGLSATSNSTEMTITGVPAGITPAGSQFVPCGVTDNGFTGYAGACQVNLTSVLIFYKLHTTAIQYQTTAFTNSGTKGISADFTVTYSLQ